MHRLSIAEVKRLAKPKEVTEHILGRIAELDGRFGAFHVVTTELARQQAAQASQQRLLEGVPIALKDFMHLEGYATSGGMTVLDEIKQTETATVARRLIEAGAVIVGKVTLTDGVFTTHHPARPPPKNPWGEHLWPGVSSSGSGVALAAGLAYGAIGSDTGGSIRFPSSACGVTGLKPTWGRVSRHGCVELAGSLDHVGPMARSAADVALMLQVMAGRDALDPTSSFEAVPDYVAAAETRSLPGWKIGLDTAFALNAAPEVQAALNSTLSTLEALGGEVVPLQMPPETTAVAAEWRTQCGVECGVAHSATFPSRRSEYGPQLAALIDDAAQTSAAHLHRIAVARRDFTGRLEEQLRRVDVMLVPAIPEHSVLAADHQTVLDGARGASMSTFTVPFDFSGHPTITFPGAFVGRSPIGIQLVARHFGEASLIAACAAFQSATDFHLRDPELS